MTKKQVPDICASRWTKLGPVLDWLLAAELPHHIFSSCFKKCGVQRAKPAGAAGCVAGAEVADSSWRDPVLHSQVAFHVLKGSRFAASCAFLGDAGKLRTLIMLEISLECLRFLSAWLMRRARETDRWPDRVPFLDQLHLPLSPLQAATQYVASLLRGDDGSERLILLWYHQGSVSFKKVFYILGLCYF